MKSALVALFVCLPTSLARLVLHALDKEFSIEIDANTNIAKELEIIVDSCKTIFKADFEGLDFSELTCEELEYFDMKYFEKNLSVNKANEMYHQIEELSRHCMSSDIMIARKTIDLDLLISFFIFLFLAHLI